MKKILQVGHPKLRKVSRLIAVSEIKSGQLKKLIKLMKETLALTEAGIALAAPQIGYNLRIFVVSPRVFQPQGPALNPPKGRAFESFETVFINPNLIKCSKKKKIFEEGCLSAGRVYGKIKRSEKVIVEAFDEKGRKFRRGASGLLAEILQHEIDHLDGRLFIDSATDLQKMPPAKINT